MEMSLGIFSPSLTLDLLVQVAQRALCRARPMVREFGELFHASHFHFPYNSFVQNIRQVPRLVVCIALRSRCVYSTKPC